MSRDEIWIRFMSATLGSIHPCDFGYAEELTSKAAKVADYALGEYEKRCHERPGPGVIPVRCFAPIYSAKSSEGERL